MAISTAISTALATTLSFVAANAGTILSIGTTVGSAVAGGAVALAQGEQARKSASQQADYQEKLAKNAEEQARQKSIDIQNRSNQEERVKRRHNAMMLSRNRARIGSGGLSYTGSPLSVEIQNAMDMEMDLQNFRINTENEIKNTKYGGGLASMNYSNAASLSRSQASIASSNGLMNGLVQTGSGLLSAFGSGLSSVWDTSMFGSKDPTSGSGSAISGLSAAAFGSPSGGSAFGGVSSALNTANSTINSMKGGQFL